MYHHISNQEIYQAAERDPSLKENLLGNKEDRNTKGALYKFRKTSTSQNLLTSSHGNGYDLFSSNGKVSIRPEYADKFRGNLEGQAKIKFRSAEENFKKDLNRLVTPFVNSKKKTFNAQDDYTGGSVDFVRVFSKQEAEKEGFSFDPVSGEQNGKYVLIQNEDGKTGTLISQNEEGLWQEKEVNICEDVKNCFDRMRDNGGLNIMCGISSDRGNYVSRFLQENGAHIKVPNPNYIKQTLGMDQHSDAYHNLVNSYGQGVMGLPFSLLRLRGDKKLAENFVPLYEGSIPEHIEKASGVSITKERHILINTQSNNPEIEFHAKINGITMFDTLNSTQDYYFFEHIKIHSVFSLGELSDEKDVGYKFKSLDTNSKLIKFLIVGEINLEDSQLSHQENADRIRRYYELANEEAKINNELCKLEKEYKDKFESDNEDYDQEEKLKADKIIQDLKSQAEWLQLEGLLLGKGEFNSDEINNLVVKSIEKLRPYHRSSIKKEDSLSIVQRGSLLEMEQQFTNRILMRAKGISSYKEMRDVLKQYHSKRAFVDLKGNHLKIRNSIGRVDKKHLNDQQRSKLLKIEESYTNRMIQFSSQIDDQGYMNFFLNNCSKDVDFICDMLKYIGKEGQKNKRNFIINSLTHIIEIEDQIRNLMSRDDEESIEISKNLQNVKNQLEKDCLALKNGGKYRKKTMFSMHNKIKGFFGKASNHRTFFGKCVSFMEELLLSSVPIVGAVWSRFRLNKELDDSAEKFSVRRTGTRTAKILNSIQNTCIEHSITAEIVDKSDNKSENPVTKQPSFHSRQNYQNNMHDYTVGPVSADFSPF